jgi:hypothetical protein
MNPRRDRLREYEEEAGKDMVAGVGFTETSLNFTSIYDTGRDPRFFIGECRIGGHFEGGPSFSGYGIL